MNNNLKINKQWPVGLDYLIILKINVSRFCKNFKSSKFCILKSKSIHSDAYRKHGKIHWANLSWFSRFPRVVPAVPPNFTYEYKHLSLIILTCNKHFDSNAGQGNIKVFPWKFQWGWNCKYLAQRIFNFHVYSITSGNQVFRHHKKFETLYGNAIEALLFITSHNKQASL